MPITAILFDIDGTLVDSNNFHVLAWDEAFREAGFVYDREALHGQIGKGADNYVPALLPDVDEQQAEKLGDAHGRIYKAKYLPHVRPFPGARELLERCRQEGLQIALASSASGEELEHYLDLLDCRTLIDGFTSADDVGCSKPCPDIFETAREKLGARAPDSLVIGDTPYDIQAACRAGMKAIAVRSGGFTDDVLIDAIAIYDDVGSLLERFDASPISQIEEAV
jgi:membrane protein